MNKYCTKVMTVCAVASLMAACSKDKDPVIVIPPSTGSTITLNGLISTEAGSSAGNSVFVDFSADKQYPIARASWDLGFYNGTDFRVKINQTAVAMGVVTTKTDLASVTAADTAGIKLAFNQNAPSASDLLLTDDLSGDITKTLIPAVSATATDNKVIILNRGTGGGLAARDYVKLRITRNGTGYTVQYAALAATTYNTVQVDKSGTGTFTYVSLDNGATVSGFPDKKNWDIEWSYSTYQTGGLFYPFSDLVMLNTYDNIQAIQRLYADAATASTAYTNFNLDSAAKYTLSSDRWVIGSNWRATTGTTGVKTDRFYVVKDAAANYYKVKFVSFITADGGTRGKPVITYELLK